MNMKRRNVVICVLAVAVSVVGCSDAGPVNTSGVQPVPLALEIDGTLQTYEQGTVWVEMTLADFQGVEPAELARTDNRVFIDQDGVIWGAIGYDTDSRERIRTEDGVYGIYWAYEVARHTCYFGEATCIRQIRITDEPRLRSDTDSLWDDDERGWLRAEIVSPGDDFVYIQDLANGTIETSVIYVSVENSVVSVAVEQQITQFMDPSIIVE